MNDKQLQVFLQLFSEHFFWNILIYLKRLLYKLWDSLAIRLSLSSTPDFGKQIWDGLVSQSETFRNAANHHLGCTKPV